MPEEGYRPVQPMPVPTSFAIMAAQGMDGTTRVVLRLDTPSGSTQVFFDAESARALGDAMTRAAGELSSLNGGIVPATPEDIAAVKRAVIIDK